LPSDRPPAPPAGWQPPQWQQPDREAWRPAHWQEEQAGQGAQGGHGQSWQPPGQQGWQTQQRPERPGWAVAGAIALISLGSLMALFFGLIFLGLEEIVELDPQLTMTPAMIDFTRLVLGAIVVIAVLQVVGGVGSLARWQWARVVGILSGVLGLLLGVLLLLGVAAAPDPIALVIAVVLTAGYALGVIGLVLGGAHFRRGY